MKQIDIITAFLYSFLDENIFVNQLKKYMINVVLVYHLQKALDGLKHAFYIWYA